MGIGRPTLEIFSSLYKKGFFDRINSVIELGSEELHINAKKDIEVFLRSIGIKNIDEEIKRAYAFKRTIRHRILFPCRFPAKILYEWLGIKEYESIDANGEFGAHAFDLNKDLRKEYNYRKKFDLVTNHGTTEHVFDQHMCFKNVHELTKKGGFMLHAAPLIYLSGINHAFYYVGPAFYKDLSAANDYTVKGIWVVINNRIIKPYSDMFFKKKIKDLDFVNMFYLLRKNSDKPFNIPQQGSYSGDFKLNYSKEKIPSLKFTNQVKRPLWRRIAKRMLEIKF